jgi:hypothetical protein
MPVYQLHLTKLTAPLQTRGGKMERSLGERTSILPGKSIKTVAVRADARPRQLVKSLQSTSPELADVSAQMGLSGQTPCLAVLEAETLTAPASLHQQLLNSRPVLALAGTASAALRLADQQTLHRVASPRNVLMRAAQEAQKKK